MTWNHRVVRRVYKRTRGDDEVFYGIHEVYYRDGVPYALTSNAVSLGSDSIEGLRDVLRTMRKCLLKPTLEYDDFGKGGKYYDGE